MDLGPHADDVMDFADFVLSGGIFRDQRPPVLPKLKIIRSMAEVTNYIGASPGVPPKRAYEWTELCARAGEPSTSAREIEELHRFRAMPGLLDNIGKLVDGPIQKFLKRQFQRKYTNADIRELSWTINNILNYRATHGRTLPFIERLVEVYRLGGHPCGWVGAYPEGHLVAYFPGAGDISASTRPTRRSGSKKLPSQSPIQG